MAGTRVIARNLAANWVSQGANLLVMFFLSPFVIHRLGLTAYGLWSALNVLVGYMGVLDLGIRASTGRHVILYVGRDDHRGIDETIRTSLALFSWMGAVFVAVGMLLGWQFPSLFPKVPEEYRDLLLVLLPVMGASVWVSMIRIVLSSVLTAHDRFDLARSLELAALAVRTGGTVAALGLGYGIGGLVFVVLVSNVVALAGTFVVARRVYPSLRILPFTLAPTRLRELFGYGIPAAITSAAVKIMAQTDVIVVSACISFGAAGTYTTGANLVNYSATFLGQIAATYFPPVQRAVARNEMDTARQLFLRQVRLALLFGLPIYVGLIVFGREFLHLWVYDPVKFPQEAVATAAQVMAILAVSYLLVLFRAGADSLLSAMGHIRFTAGLAMAQALVNLGLSILFVVALGWGTAGVAAGTLAGQLLTSTAVMPWYVCRKAGLNLRRFAAEVAGPGFLAGALFAAVCYVVRSLLPGATWGTFWLQVTAATVCYFPIALFVLAPMADRRRLLGLLLTRPRPA